MFSPARSWIGADRRRQVTPVFTSSNLASLIRDIWRSSLHLSHPSSLGQQNAAPIPAAALVKSVVGAINQSLAVQKMAPIATGIDRGVISDFQRIFGDGRGAEGSFVRAALLEFN